MYCSYTRPFEIVVVCPCGAAWALQSVHTLYVFFVAGEAAHTFYLVIVEHLCTMK